MPPWASYGLLGPLGASCGILKRICAHEPGHQNEDILNIWPTWDVKVSASLETSSKSAPATKGVGTDNKQTA
eukprot:1294912-Pyramimonas_sp.AAC.1